MARKFFIKILIVTLLFTFLFGMEGLNVYSAESGPYDGTWNAEPANLSSFTFQIKGNTVEAFTLVFGGETYSFPSVNVDLKEKYFISYAGSSWFEIAFDPDDQTIATGTLMLWPDNPNATVLWSVVSAVNTKAPNPTPIVSNPDLTYLDKSAWENILPEKDQKLADTLACLNDMAWNGKNYVIAGRGKILSSTDGRSWKTAYSMKEDHALYGVVWNGKEYTAIGTDESDNSAIVMKSANGTDWKEINPKIDGYMLDIATNNKTYAAVGDAGVLITSADGINWAKADISVTSNFYRIIWAGNQFVAVGNDVIVTSSDGSDWKTVSGQEGNFSAIVYYKEQFCIVDSSGKILITKDFKKWSSKQVELPSSNNYIVNAACSKDRILVAIGNEAGVLSSSDMSKWELDSLQTGEDTIAAINNIILVNGRYYIIGPQYISLYIPTAANTSAIKVIINGSTPDLSSAPYLSGSVPMLPLRAVLEAAGVKVKASGTKITITRGTKTGTLTVNSTKATLNKKSATLEAKVVSKEGVVYAPLEKIIKALGGTYKWDATKNTVTISFRLAGKST